MMNCRTPAIGVTGALLFAIALLLFLRTSSGQSPSGANPSAPKVFNPGPDIITGDIGEFGGLVHFGSSGTQVGLGMGTTACNGGDQGVNFMGMRAPNHPVIS